MHELTQTILKYITDIQYRHLTSEDTELKNSTITDTLLIQIKLLELDQQLTGLNSLYETTQNENTTLNETLRKQTDEISSLKVLLKDSEIDWVYTENEYQNLKDTYYNLKKKYTTLNDRYQDLIEESNDITEYLEQ